MLKVTTAPTILPVTLDSCRLELKLHSLDTTENNSLTDKIAGLSLQFEHLYGFTLTTTVYEWLHDCPGLRLGLPRYPVASVASVSQLEDDFTTWTALSNWHLIGDTIHFEEQPEPRLHKIAFTAGHASQNLVPKDVAIAIRQGACHLHRNRESHTEANLKELALGWATIARSNQRIIAR